MAILASTEKNQIASLQPAFRVRGRGTIVASVEIVASPGGRSE
jgi:hypothetical protein